MKKIGIMGGTFNPIHYGHLMIAEEVRVEFKLDSILFIPALNPPHKHNLLISAYHRYNMTCLATESNPFFQVSDIEITRSPLEPSYTYNTIMSLKETYGPNTEFYFIIGADCIHTLPTWYNFDVLKKEITFLVTKRPNYDFKASDISSLGVNFKKLATPELEISSTDLRERIKAGRNIHYFLPESVINYIKQEQLYI